MGWSLLLHIARHLSSLLFVIYNECSLLAVFLWTRTCTSHTGGKNLFLKMLSTSFRTFCLLTTPCYASGTGKFAKDFLCCVLEALNKGSNKMQFQMEQSTNRQHMTCSIISKYKALQNKSPPPLVNIVQSMTEPTHTTIHSHIHTYCQSPVNRSCTSLQPSCCETRVLITATICDPLFYQTKVPVVFSLKTTFHVIWCNKWPYLNKKCSNLSANISRILLR